jgi:putative oxidoreductase
LYVSNPALGAFLWERLDWGWNPHFLHSQGFSMMTNFSKNVLIPLLLRLMLAAIFIFHGLDLVGGPEKEWGANWNNSPDAPPKVVQFAVAWGQLIGGVALALGFLTRLAALGIIVIMVGAIATLHWPNGFDIRENGFEYNVAIIVMCLCLMLGGPGPIAVDWFFRFRRRET